MRFFCIRCDARFNACVYTKCLGNKCELRIDCLAYEIVHVTWKRFPKPFRQVTKIWAKPDIKSLLADDRGGNGIFPKI